eukprot:2781871-Rhodomonas_salina.1
MDCADCRFVASPAQGVLGLVGHAKVGTSVDHSVVGGHSSSLCCCNGNATKEHVKVRGCVTRARQHTEVVRSRFIGIV